jgi:hypothetical protein
MGSLLALIFHTILKILRFFFFLIVQDTGVPVGEARAHRNHCCQGTLFFLKKKKFGSFTILVVFKGLRVCFDEFI